MACDRRYLPFGLLIGSLVVVGCGLGLAILGASTWLDALLVFCLAVTLGSLGAWRVTVEAKRQGWGTNLEH